MIGANGEQYTDCQDYDSYEIWKEFLQSFLAFESCAKRREVGKLAILAALAKVVMALWEKQRKYLGELIDIFLHIVLKVCGVGLTQSKVDELDILPVASDEDIAAFEVVVHELERMDILQSI